MLSSQSYHHTRPPGTQLSNSIVPAIEKNAWLQGCVMEYLSPLSPPEWLHACQQATTSCKRCRSYLMPSLKSVSDVLMAV